MIDINLHTHTRRCGHASGEDREYVENAVKAGFREIGFSDHAPFMTADGKESGYRVSHADTPGYFESLRALREEFKDRIAIHIGFEMEYYEENFEDMLSYARSQGAEYLILGQHFLGNEHVYREGTSAASDSVERLDKYLELVLKGLKTGLFSYVAHPDIIRFTGDDKAYEDRIRSFIREVVKLGYPLELNRLGFFEKRHYPRDLFWKIAGEEGATAVIGLDAHTPEVYLDRETVKKIEAYLEEHHVKRILPQMIRI